MSIAGKGQFNEYLSADLYIILMDSNSISTKTCK